MQLTAATLMQEDYSSNTADYRFRINSENSVVRVNMYVTAMGRDIIYYITFSGLSEGAGDFITSVTVEEKGGSAGPDSAESGSEESNPGESSSGERGVSAQAENTASGTDSLSGETGVSAGTDGSQENAGTQSIEQAEGESAESTTEAGQTTSAEASAVTWRHSIPCFFSQLPMLRPKTMSSSMISIFFILPDFPVCLSLRNQYTRVLHRHHP